MNKQKIISVFIQELQREFDTLSKAALEAREAATSEESKPENEYDTRSLEASYLAGAQAKRAAEIKDLIQKFKIIKPIEYTKDQPIGPTALVHVEIDASEKRLFFMIPIEGGQPVQVDNQEVTILSLQSPLGLELSKQKVGHSFVFKVKNNEREYEILKVE